MFKSRATIEMERAFAREFRSLLTSVTLNKLATDDVLDPVTEIYSGGTDAVTEVFLGMLRNYKVKIVDGIDVNIDYRKLTVPQSYVTAVPEVNDTITVGSQVYLVKAIDTDAADVFYNLKMKKPS